MNDTNRGALLCVSALLLALGGACDDSASETMAPAAPEPPVATGPAADYGRYCALCHGEFGEGYMADHANMLANQDWLAAASDEFIRSAIVAGRPGTPMSAWGDAHGGPMTGPEVAELVSYIRAWQTVDTAAIGHEPLTEVGEPLRGRPIYNARCATCHGPDGQGGNAVSLNNPQFLADASDAYLADAVLRGRAGTTMRGYGGDLTAQSVADLVALFRTWQTDVPQPQAVVLDHDLANAAVNPAGPDPQFTVTGDYFVAVADVVAALGAGARMLFIDARPPGDFVAEHISGAVSVPFYAAEDAVDVLPRDVWVVAYCGCPHAESSQAADVLRAHGYDKVVVLDEGFFVWRDEGHPVTVGAAP